MVARRPFGSCDNLRFGTSSGRSIEVFICVIHKKKDSTEQVMCWKCVYSVDTASVQYISGDISMMSFEISALYSDRS